MRAPRAEPLLRPGGTTARELDRFDAPTSLPPPGEADETYRWLSSGGSQPVFMLSTSEDDDDDDAPAASQVLRRASTDGDQNARPRTCLDRWIKYLVDPRRTCHLLFIHVLVCCFIPGPYFFDSLFGAYKEDLQNKMHINNTQYSLILATGSLSAVLSGPAGFLVRSWGISKSCLLFGTAVVLGSLLLILAVEWQIYFLAVVGRVLFWAGICTTGVVQVVVVFLLFSKKYAAIAQAGVLAACRIGGTIGYVLADPLKRYFRAADPDPEHVLSAPPAFLQALKFSFIFVAISGCCYLGFAYLYSGTEISRKIRPLLAAGAGNAAGKGGSGGSGGPGVKDLSLLCIVHQALIGLLYTVVFVFEYNGCLTLQKVAHVSEDVAGFAISLIPGISVVSLFLSPLLNDFQRLVRFSATAFVLLFLGQGVIALKAHYALEHIDTVRPVSAVGAFTHLVDNLVLAYSPPYVVCVLLGVGFGCCVVPLWTMVPHVCMNKELEVIHVGACYMQQSLWLFFGNILYGHLVDATGGYFASQLFFTILGVIGFLGVLFVNRGVNKKTALASGTSSTAGTAEGNSGTSSSSRRGSAPMGLPDPARSSTETAAGSCSQIDLMKTSLLTGGSTPTSSAENGNCDPLGKSVSKSPAGGERPPRAVVGEAPSSSSDVFLQIPMDTATAGPGGTSGGDGQPEQKFMLDTRARIFEPSKLLTITERQCSPEKMYGDRIALADGGGKSAPSNTNLFYAEAESGVPPHMRNLLDDDEGFEATDESDALGGVLVPGEITSNATRNKSGHAVDVPASVPVRAAKDEDAEEVGTPSAAADVAVDVPDEDYVPTAPVLTPVQPPPAEPVSEAAVASVPDSAVSEVATDFTTDVATEVAAAEEEQEMLFPPAAQPQLVQAVPIDSALDGSQSHNPSDIADSSVAFSDSPEVLEIPANLVVDDTETTTASTTPTPLAPSAEERSIEADEGRTSSLLPSTSSNVSEDSTTASSAKTSSTKRPPGRKKNRKK